VVNEPTGIRVLSTTSVKVIRCGCGDPHSHIPNPCPTPSEIEDLGVVASSETIEEPE
jgi:hypothetical protein